MLDITLNNTENKLPVRCSKCDREMAHYITFTSPKNDNSIICWECTDREEKGLNTKRNWKRMTRLTQTRF